MLHDRTAFYGLSLIAQTPDGAMSLKDFGWETYRVRSHSIPATIANTDTYQCVERRLSRIGTMVSTRKSLSSSTSPSLSVSTSIDEEPVKRDIRLADTIDRSEVIPRSFQDDASLRNVKVKRSVTMPSTIELQSNDEATNRHGK